MTSCGRFASLLLWLLIASSAFAGMRAGSRYGDLPMVFEENAGQTDARVRYLARGPGYTLFITPQETVAVLGRGNETPAVVRMRWMNANDGVPVRGEVPLTGRSTYLIGSDPARWKTDVAHYARVRLTGVYDGIDVLHHAVGRDFEYDLVVSPGADPESIRIRFEGADRIEISDAGDLLLTVPGGVLSYRAPVAYQMKRGRRERVPAAYRRIGGRDFGVTVRPYDRTRPLIIDPVLVYSTYLGGSGDDLGAGIAVDAGGNAYVTGSTRSADFPAANAFQSASAGAYDAFVSKLNADGSQLIYSTYLGGSLEDTGTSIAIDVSGNAYVTGSTVSLDFPVVLPIQAAHGGSHDVFVTKLSSAGSAIVYSTYLGGSELDGGKDIAVDGTGAAYVTGLTNSENFPTVNALQGTYGGGGLEAFVFKITNAGALGYSTFIGGSDAEYGNSIAVDEAGNAGITGATTSPDFPTANAIQPVSGGFADPFVSKLNASGSAFIYSTHLGGNGINEFGSGIAFDDLGNAYVTGFTSSTNFPLVNPYRSTSTGHDAFASKISPDGSALLYSTFLGGGSGRAVAVDTSGSAFIIGSAAGGDFPTINAVQPAFGGGGADAIVVRLDPAGTTALYSTYLGGSGVDAAIDIALDADASAYIVGETGSADFPTVAPFQSTLRGPRDAFLAKLAEAAPAPAPPDAAIPTAGPGVLALLAFALAVTALMVLRGSR